MAKKKIDRKELMESLKGSLSTAIVTLFIISVAFFIPMISAREVQKAREGKGMYKPQEDIIWDLNEKSDLQTFTMNHVSDTASIRSFFEWGKVGITYGSPYDDEGTIFNGYWIYKSKNTNTNLYQNTYGKLQSNFMDLPISESGKTVDNYLIATLQDGTLFNGHPNIHFTGPIQLQHRREEIVIYTDIKIDEWIEKDATKIHYYAKFESNIQYIQIFFEAVSLVTGNTYSIQNTIKEIENPTELEGNITLKIEDIISLLSLSSQGKLALRVIFISKLTLVGGDDHEKEFTLGSNFIFDYQVYGLFPKTNSITVLSIWNVVQSVGIFILGVVMLPQLSIGGLGKLLGLVKK